MSISEVFGEYRCGKTQLSQTMSVVAQLPKDLGGGEGKVAYIDTEGTFRPERITQIAERFGVDPETALENILYARALNSEHQHELLNALAKEFAGGEFVLLVIDSIMACFRVDYQGRGELSDRQGKLNQFLSKLSHMAEEYNIAVLMVCACQPGSPQIVLGSDADYDVVADEPSPERSRSKRTLRWGRWAQAGRRSYPCTCFNYSSPIAQGSG